MNLREAELEEMRNQRDEARAEVMRLKILGPDAAERVTCEARAIAAEMMQPALQAWKEENETLRAEVERQAQTEARIRADERAKVLTELRPLVEAIDTAGNECACGLLPANSSDDCESCEARKKVGELRKAVGL